MLQDLEKQGIISKDRERTIQQLNEELDMKKEEINGHLGQLDQLQVKMNELSASKPVICQLTSSFTQ